MKNKSTSFLGIINGVQYDNVQDFKQAVKNMYEPKAENVIQTIVRPALYRTDEDYIIPNVTEFHFEKLPDQSADVTQKLEQRMAYFTQEFSKGNISFNTLQNLIEKTKQGIVDIQQHLDVLSGFIDFLTLRGVNVSRLVEENDATEDILGFYVAMLDNFEDYSKKEIPFQEVPIPESTDVMDTIIDKIRELDATQIDQLVKVLQNR